MQHRTFSRLPGTFFTVALLLQCLAPPGYMAGSLAEGWPVVLCPEGLPSGFLDDGHHHHSSDDTEHDASSSVDGYCPLGSMLEKVPLPTAAVALAGRSFLTGSARPVPHSRFHRLTLSAHPARGPPLVSKLT